MKTYHLKSTKTTTTTSSTITSTSTTTTHGRKESEIVMNLESLKELFFEVLNRPMPNMIVQRVLYDLKEDEHAYPYYSYALRETAEAPRPSWRYVEAIMMRLRREQTPVEWLMPY